MVLKLIGYMKVRNRGWTANITQRFILMKDNYNRLEKAINYLIRVIGMSQIIIIANEQEADQEKILTEKNRMKEQG